jgi:predicted dinucleotide-binding enzyme
MESKIIGIIGAGNVGHALATSLVKTGHVVKVANTQGADSLQEFVVQTGARAVNLSEVAEGVNVLIIAVPLHRIPDLEPLIKTVSPDVAIIDTSNYIPLLNGNIQAIEDGLAVSEWVAQQLNVPVVKAFNNITSYGMANNGKAKDAADRIALPVSGEDADRKKVIMELVDALGFDAFDAGSLKESWRQDIGEPAYCTDSSLQELPGLLAKADVARARKLRDIMIDILIKLPPTFPPQGLIPILRFAVGLDS